MNGHTLSEYYSSFYVASYNSFILCCLPSLWGSTLELSREAKRKSQILFRFAVSKIIFMLPPITLSFYVASYNSFILCCLPSLWGSTLELSREAKRKSQILFRFAVSKILFMLPPITLSFYVASYNSFILCCLHSLWGSTLELSREATRKSQILFRLAISKIIFMLPPITLSFYVASYNSFILCCLPSL